jgi:hypothetical protein
MPSIDWLLHADHEVAPMCRSVTPAIQTCFAGLDMEEVEIKYQVGGGALAARKELVVWSGDQGAEPAGLC